MAYISTEANSLIDLIGESPPIKRRLSRGIGSTALYLGNYDQGEYPTGFQHEDEEEDSAQYDLQRLYVMGVRALPVHGEAIADVAVLTRDPMYQDIAGKSARDFQYAALLRKLEDDEIERFHDEHPATVQVHNGHELLLPRLVLPRAVAIFDRTDIVAPYVKIA
jgi:hypothetical protein